MGSTLSDRCCASPRSLSARVCPAKCTLCAPYHPWRRRQNAYGELGLGDAVSRSAPTGVGFFDGKRVVDVACGNEQTAVLCGAYAAF